MATIREVKKELRHREWAEEIEVWQSCECRKAQPIPVTFGFLYRLGFQNMVLHFFGRNLSPIIDIPTQARYEICLNPLHFS